MPALLGESGYRTAIFGKSHFKSCLSHRGKADPDSIESAPRRNDTDYFRSWQGPWFGFEHAEINVGHTNEPHSASMHYRAWLEDRGVDIEAFFSDYFDGPTGQPRPEPREPSRLILPMPVFGQVLVSREPSSLTLTIEPWH